MIPTKREIIPPIAPLPGLTPKEAEELDRCATIVACPPGRVLCAPGETSDALFVLKSGSVQLYRLSPDGKKLVVATLGAGDVFGEPSLIGEGMQYTFAESIEHCSLWSINRADTQRLLATHPTLALHIVQSMACRISDIEAHLEELAFTRLSVRMARLLLRLSGGEMPKDVIAGFSHQEIAEKLGTYRETTTQILDLFKRQGWIAIGRKHLTILNRTALQEHAKGTAPAGGGDARGIASAG